MKTFALIAASVLGLTAFTASAQAEPFGHYPHAWGGGSYSSQYGNSSYNGYGRANYGHSHYGQPNYGRSNYGHSSHGHSNNGHGHFQSHGHGGW